MAIKIVRVNGPNEIKLDGTLYDLASEHGCSLSALLEEMNPTHPDDKSGLDAFDRQLQRLGIVRTNDPEHGIYAGQGKLFFQSNLPESRILFPEYINRRINAAMIERGDFLQYIVSEWEYGRMFRSIYLDDTQTQRRSGKRAQGARPKVLKAAWSEKNVKIEDFAIEIQADYDFIQEVQLPILDVILQRAAMTRVVDELGEAVSVILSGDGTGKESTGAYVDKLSDLGIEGNTGVESMTFKSYLKWQAQFYPYKMTAIIGSITDLVDFYTMTTPTDTTYALLTTMLSRAAVGGDPVFAQSPFGAVNLIPFNDTSVLGTDDLIGVDKTFGIIGHRNTGVDLVETDRLIREKWQVIVISNKVGFSNLFRAATRKLDGKA
ncbi:MAG: hypothetical protein A4E60_00242 [Syntrophorhabdus sp. PtaB.Bin047]|nr:MAG: hypothetical protein A4E60_00242 [Syntrophorhabdus sp. PtaB.Bin047]